MLYSNWLEIPLNRKSRKKRPLLNPKMTTKTMMPSNRKSLKRLNEGNLLKIVLSVERISGKNFNNSCFLSIELYLRRT